MLTPCHTPDLAAIGCESHALIRELYPICRSITGDGVRESLQVVGRLIPLEVHEVPTGTQVFDWTVPKEWNVRDAWIKDPRGQKVVDFRACNLHVVSYSVPVHRRLPLEELKSHLWSLPDHPDWIPYRTSYYAEDWGFCVRAGDLAQWEDGEYEVCIDSSLSDGFLTYGEYFVQGEEDTETLISAHICHPALCNDNLSGVTLAALLAREITRHPGRHSYRFLFIPGTIGAITWLALNEQRAGRIAHGLVLAGLGDSGGLTYKRSRRGESLVDRAAAQVLRERGRSEGVVDFDPYGYDERQYCSPGFDLPVGRLSRSIYGTYPQYHTSADDLGFVSGTQLANSYEAIVQILRILEGNGSYISTNPKCEPQLGRRGLYASPGAAERALLWVLNLADGKHDLLEVASRSGLAFSEIRRAADRLCEAGLIVPAGKPTSIFLAS